MNTITFFYGQNSEGSDAKNEKSFLDVPKGLFAADKYIDIPQDTLQKNMQEAIERITDVLEKLSVEKSKFEIDEIELGLNIGADGKVSVIALEGTASMNTSVKVKLKRK